MFQGLYLQKKIRGNPDFFYFDSAWGKILLYLESNAMKKGLVLLFIAVVFFGAKKKAITKKG
ncbi:MAG: hypothetical protein COC06_10200 [Bacteroidales bacterium]|nr:MAG: hypothetical protein COC06_10200 [Bacteroidales bacterium]